MSSSRPRQGQPSLFEIEAGEDTTAAPVDVIPEVAGSGSTRSQPAAVDRDDPDTEARRFAADPAGNVVLEASAGTGKTSVLVARYLNLLRAGVDPAHILAITFTRKAAAEMRERIVRDLRDAAARSAPDAALWEGLRDRLGEIAISTIDAFCLSLLREFPLEADVDPGFEMADETEVPRLVEEALDQALRVITSLARTEPDVGLVLAQLGLGRTREGLAILLGRRLVAWPALNRFLAHGPAGLTAETVCRRTATALIDALRTVQGGLPQVLADGPVAHPRYALLLRDVERLGADVPLADADLRAILNRVARHFLTADGKPRSRGGAIAPYRKEHYPSEEAARRHRAAVSDLGERIKRVVFEFNRDLNVVLARGIRRMFGIALTHYRRALEERSVLDFSDVLERALELLRQMDEFAQSRYRLESRYHHVLVDEFQDTSQAQWELVSLIIRSWGEGLGLATHPSVFIVGDRKQSIYRFRDAEVGVMDEARQFIETLRPGDRVRRSIARSFRAVPELLAFVNDAFTEMSQEGGGAGAFHYGDADRFPVASGLPGARQPVLGIAAAESSELCAAAVAAEIAGVLREATVRDRTTGVARPVRPGDVAVIFRSRASHRDFEAALEQRGIPTYVYKGLGFFDADETKDVLALLRFLARPSSDLRAAAFLRSRFVRLSDRGLAVLGPRLAEALTAPARPAAWDALDEEDRRVLAHVRTEARGWLDRADRVPPADLLESILTESAYARELRGGRSQQAWENLKKMRAIVRRIQNRGYATLPRIADHLDALTAGDESNAVLEALDAVNLMTVHAAKGLEFPIVFVVNLGKGASGPPRPVRVVAGTDEADVSIGPFVSETDEAEREREKHETRRLLYVAFTRARDRLYLASVLKNGAFVSGRGSLGEVFPDSLRGLFARTAAAPAGDGTVTWTAASGREYEFRLCRPPVDDGDLAGGQEPDSAPGPHLVLPARVEEPDRHVASEDEGREDARPGTGDIGAAIAGRIVHRLLERWGLDLAPEDPDVLLTPEERAALGRPDEVLQEALDVRERLRRRPDVRALLDSGQLLFEVPFSMRDGDSGTTVRGTIDCLVQGEDGSVTVLELKTGQPRPAHDRQLATYVRAARLLFPGRRVEGRLIYPEDRNQNPVPTV
jgi:ATP-dependent helicase/nuclease subunit A